MKMNELFSPAGLVSQVFYKNCGALNLSENNF